MAEDTSIPVFTRKPDGSPSPLNVGLYIASLSVTRPSDTNAYAAGDAVGATAAGAAGSAILEFPNIGPAGGSILITSADLMIEVASLPSGMGSQRLHLYSSAPDAILDNAAWDLASSGDRSKYLGFIDIGTPVDIGSSLFVRASQVNFDLRLASGVASIFGILQTVAGYTPTSAAAFKIRLRAVPL